MIFPIKVKTDSFLTVRGAKFGSLRWTDKNKNGIMERENECRNHAGCDLYCDNKTPVFAMEDGQIINCKLFYLGTYEIQISGQEYIIRYGEISPIKDLKINMKVKEGDIIGTVRKCQGISQPMLHLEFYLPNTVGSLTNMKRPQFYRHENLIDGTEILKNLMV